MHSAICSAAMLLISEAMMSYSFRLLEIWPSQDMPKELKELDKKELLENVSATAMDFDRKAAEL